MNTPPNEVSIKAQQYADDLAPLIRLRLSSIHPDELAEREGYIAKQLALAYVQGYFEGVLRASSIPRG